MLSYACEAGITPSEFWDMSIAEVECVCRGYEMRLSRQSEVQRLVAFTAYMGLGGKVSNIKEFYPLLSDTDTRAVKLITKDEFNTFITELGYVREETKREAGA